MLNVLSVDFPASYQDKRKPTDVKMLAFEIKPTSAKISLPLETGIHQQGYKIEKFFSLGNPQSRHIFDDDE